MKKRLNLPHGLLITGQSGSGKGTIVMILKKLAKKYGLELYFSSCGDDIRAACESGSYIGDKMRRINNQGLRQPSWIATAFTFMGILKDLKPEQYAIFEGMPRSVSQFYQMQELLEFNYLGSMQILEVAASTEICRERLIKRAIEEKREDICIDGKPGVPDMKKIETKLAWYTKDGHKIIDLAHKKNMALYINNEGTLFELEQHLEAMFVH